MLACGFWDTHRMPSLEFLGERDTIGAVGGVRLVGPSTALTCITCHPFQDPAGSAGSAQRKRVKRRTLHGFQVAISYRGI